MKTDNSILIKVDVNEQLPKENRNYLVILQYPNKDIAVKKVFFHKEWKLKNGKKDCKVLQWFKKVTIDEELYKTLINK